MSLPSWIDRTPTDSHSRKCRCCNSFRGIDSERGWLPADGRLPGGECLTAWAGSSVWRRSDSRRATDSRRDARRDDHRIGQPHSHGADTRVRPIPPANANPALLAETSHLKDGICRRSHAAGRTRSSDCRGRDEGGQDQPGKDDSDRALGKAAPNRNGEPWRATNSFQFVTALTGRNAHQRTSNSRETPRRSGSSIHPNTAKPIINQWIPMMCSLILSISASLNDRQYPSR